MFGTPEIVTHKDEILRAHCADVGRDPAAIERTVGCKITIRSTEAEAERVRRAMLAHNRTPLAAVDGDVTFWTGTPEQIAETMVGYRRSASTPSSSSCRRPVRRRDDGDARCTW